jgi:hypothetical protein
VYQSQKAKKNRKGKLRQSLGLKKQQSMISTKNERENIAESVETSKTIGHFTLANDIYHKSRSRTLNMSTCLFTKQKTKKQIAPSIRKIEQSNLTKNLQQLSRSDSSNLPRQPYEYKPDTGSFPSIKGNVDSSPLGNDSSSSTGLPLPIHNMPPMIAPKSPRPSPRPSPYSSLNIANHYSFGQSYPPSSHVQPQQAFSNPCLMPQPIPLTTHSRHHHYKSAPCSPVHVRQPYGNSFW